jgi:hypothetical protein
MDADLSAVELGFVVNLKVLREVLKGLKIEGCRWWISSDPEDAVESGFVSIGHGYPRCMDRLNTLHFHLPVIGNGGTNSRTDKLILVLEPSVITQVDPCLYVQDGRVLEAPIEDFVSFYGPLQRALLARLQAGN